MAAFKMGSFNIIVVTSVTTLWCVLVLPSVRFPLGRAWPSSPLSVAGIPTIPYYIRYLIHGEPPRRKDFFEVR